MRSRVLLTVAVCLYVGVTVTSAAESVSVQVLEDSGDRIVIGYRIGDFAEQPVIIDGFEYTRITLPGESKIKVAGVPEVPRVCRSVAILGDAKMSVRVLASEHYDVTDIDVVPSKGILLRTVDPDDVPYTFGEVYQTDTDYPGELVAHRDPFILRNVRGLTVVLNPFQYNPVSRTLRVYTSVTVEVAKVGPGEINVLEQPRQETSLAFSQIYKSHFLNNSGLRYDPMDEEGDMLIICHDAWLTNVQPLVDHKNGIGIDTTIVGVSTIPGGNNATSIKNYIQGVYDSGDLAFVLLVGDAAEVATPQSSGGASDPTYAKLAGSDHYPEIMVGRFSASTAAHVDTQVERTIEYENMPATTQNWFWKGVGIGSAEGAGIGDEGQSDIQHLNEIRGWLLGDGWTEVDQIYDPGATATQVSAALNAGRGVLNYTGHGWWEGISTTGFDVGDVNNLTNDNMLPFQIIVACNSGEFDNYATCYAEACLRATHNGEPTGAIGVYASSISQSWAPPMEGQDEFNILLTDAGEPYHSYGTMCYAGSCSMMDDYGSSGVTVFDTWILFGDPSLRVIGTVAPPTGLKVSPSSGLSSAGPVGGPFDPDSIVYTLENLDDSGMDYEVTKTQAWVSLTNPSGYLAPHATTDVTVSINSGADALGTGNYSDTVSFVNLTNHDGDTTRNVALQAGGPAAVYTFPMDTNPGWSTQGEWAFGHPTGGGGGSHGNPDPNNGATGTNVYGVNLSGDYSLTVDGPWYLTAGPLDMTGYEDVTLKFMRWLNTDYQSYVYATIDVSSNGSTWTAVWSNGTSEIADSSWSEFTYDISAVADDQSTVYVRWGYQVGSYAWAYSGWNIDDVEIWAIGSGGDTCANGMLDPDEDRIDCGGPCPPCDCTSDGECDNSLYCDGVETCDDWGHCQDGSDPCPGMHWCEEGTDSCIPHGNGDFEPDGDVDLRDFHLLQQCFGEVADGACEPGNLTGGGVIDLDDLEQFINQLSGPQ